MFSICELENSILVDEEELELGELKKWSLEADCWSLFSDLEEATKPDAFSGVPAELDLSLPNILAFNPMLRC
jgi:hypothetical protein